MAFAEEIRAAVGAVTGLEMLARDLPRETRVGGLVFYPIAGAMVGGLAALAARGAERFGALGAAVAAVGVLVALSGARTLRDLASAGWVVAGAVLLAKLLAVARLPDDARTLALPLAGMLGRWAVVVQCYGGSPAGTQGSAVQLVGRARLREFGWASAVAFGTTLAVLDAVGLVVLLAATLATLGLRVLAYRRLGGVDGRVLGASSELVELVVLGVLAGLARR